MSFMDLFKPAAPKPEDNPQSASNPTIPAGAEPPADKQPEAPASALDSYKDLWVPPAPDTENKNPTTQDMLNLDPAKLMEAAGKVDFARIVPPDALQAIAQGGEGAAKAFATALNSVAQTVYAQSTAANAQILKAALQSQRSEIEGQLPQLVKSQQLSEATREQMPELSHPAAAPLVIATQEMLRTKYPNLSVNELKAKTQEYLTSFADVVRGKPQVEDKSGKKDEFDWTKYL